MKVVEEWISELWIAFSSFSVMDRLLLWLILTINTALIVAVTLLVFSEHSPQSTSELSQELVLGLNIFELMLYLPFLFLIWPFFAATINRLEMDPIRRWREFRAAEEADS